MPDSAAATDAVSAISGPTPLPEVLGPLAKLLDDPSVVEISCNPAIDDPLPVFVERFGSDPEPWAPGLPKAHAERFVRWCATYADESLVRESPILSARIHGTEHRVEALVPPVVDAPCFSIRRHLGRPVPLEEFVPDEKPRGIVVQALRDRKNLLIAGATGSGKTTFLNSCLGELARIAPDTRLVAIEDTPEIRSPLANTIALRSSASADTGRLLVSALRLSPDRIVVGEVRDGRVLMTLAKAWNTGHPGGLTSLHANSGAEVMNRLRMLASEVPGTDPTAALAQAADLIVFIRRGRSRPEIESIQANRTDPATGQTATETLHEIP